MMANIQIRDGALYADITPSDLGLPLTTTMCHVPIPYAGMWEQMGQLFQEKAQATCPVDTGYLKRNIGYQADKGGLEVWSDAPYSAYQEYGTWKMRAQPYFEAAINEAIAQIEPSMRALAAEYMDMDGDLWYLTFRCGREGTLEECYADLEKLDRVIYFMEKENNLTAAEAGWYYDLTTLYNARNEIYQRIQELQKIEAQRQAMQGMAGFLAELMGMMLAELLMAPLTLFEIMLNDISGGIDYYHYPSH